MEKQLSIWKYRMTPLYNLPILMNYAAKKAVMILLQRLWKNQSTALASSELAKGKPDCTIIISDHTRPVPSQDILPHMIRELRMGNPGISKSHFLWPPVSIVRQPLMS